MDRKKRFPDKGYNFLIHVARNLATAFHKLHEAGLVIGDVNEGNILINASGMVAFIDCDSFQVQAGEQYFFCEVGVPRYTPPELLSLGSFANVVRSTNTDNFSLAVLIFQLLFLGRHPFAGRNTTKKDIDEETAIRQREFAYSLSDKKKQLSPPPDSLPIGYLNTDLVACLHQAFEQDRRPSAADWVRVLDAQLKDTLMCVESRLHTYPTNAPECPWCAFRKARGILYFLDDTYINASAVLGDIDSFVNGFKLDALEIKRWEGPRQFPELKPNVINKQLYTDRAIIIYGPIFPALMMILLTVFAWMPGVFLLVAWFFVYAFGPWRGRIQREYGALNAGYKKMLGNLTQLINEHDSSRDLGSYNRGLTNLARSVSDYKGLPEEFDRQRRAAEEKLYYEQLQHYLLLFRLADHEIPSIGATRKAALQNNGITTAADLQLLKTIKVPGIGPKNQQVLISWQRQMASGFVYIPDNTRIGAALDQVNDEIGKLRSKWANSIRQEYQALAYMRVNITNKASILERQIEDQARKAYQAELDLAAFNAFFKGFKPLMGI
jgi:DNA-binding helix-hairpin-helix protein with protein kinase domain